MPRAADSSPASGFVATSPLLRAIVLLVTLTNAIDAAGMTVLKPVYATEVLGDPALLGVHGRMLRRGRPRRARRCSGRRPSLLGAG